MNPLPYETIENPNAIEDFFCKEIDNADKNTFTDANMFLLAELLSKKSVPLESVDEKDKYFLYQVIEKRIKHCFTFKVEDARVIVYLSSIADTAGKAVMYLTYLQYRCKKTGTEVLTLDDVAKFFGSGFLSEDDLKTIWDKQKINKGDKNGSDNLLDYQSAMKSIQFN